MPDYQKGKFTKFGMTTTQNAILEALSKTFPSG